MTGSSGEQSLGLHLGYMLTTSAIAIALAIPFQLLIFPQHARDDLRTSTATTLRRLARLALDEVEISSLVLFTDGKDAIHAEAARLSSQVEEIKAGLRSQDGLVE